MGKKYCDAAIQTAIELENDIERKKRVSERERAISDGFGKKEYVFTIRRYILCSNWKRIWAYIDMVTTV